MGDRDEFKNDEQISQTLNGSFLGGKGILEVVHEAQNTRPHHLKEKKCYYYYKRRIL